MCFVSHYSCYSEWRAFDKPPQTQFLRAGTYRYYYIIRWLSADGQVSMAVPPFAGAFHRSIIRMPIADGEEVGHSRRSMKCSGDRVDYTLDWLCFSR